MVYVRKSISNMARAAAIASREAGAIAKSNASAGTPGVAAAFAPGNLDAIGAVAAVSVFGVSPHKAPAAAARAAKAEAYRNAVDPAVAANNPAAAAAAVAAGNAVATAVAAGVAAAAVGWNFGMVAKISRAAAEAFDDAYAPHIVGTPPITPHIAGTPPTVEDAKRIAARVAHDVNAISSRYPSVEAAAAAADACLSAADAPAAAAAAAARAVFACSDGEDLPYNTAGHAAVAAAGAFINRKDDKTRAVKAAYGALAEIDGLTDGDVDAAIGAASAAASAKPDAVPPPVPMKTFDVSGHFEEMPDCHETTKEQLNIIMEVDTFLAGFLLFSLTGRKESDMPMLTEEEKFQVVVQSFAFGVFLGATILTGMCTLGTGNWYALTKVDLIVPLVLSALGFFLLLISVASAIHIELGGDFSFDRENAALWSAVGLGLGSSVLAVLYGVCVHLDGHKYKWSFALRCEDGRWCGVKRYRIVHSERHSTPGCFDCACPCTAVAGAGDGDGGSGGGNGGTGHGDGAETAGAGEGARLAGEAPGAGAAVAGVLPAGAEAAVA